MAVVAALGTIGIGLAAYVWSNQSNDSESEPESYEDQMIDGPCTCPDVPADTMHAWSICKIAIDMREKKLYTAANLAHCESYHHGPRTCCPTGRNCPIFVALETSSSYSLEHRCHMKIYWHPPRSQTRRRNAFHQMDCKSNPSHRDVTNFHRQVRARLNSIGFGLPNLNYKYDYLLYLLIELAQYKGGQFVSDLQNARNPKKLQRLMDHITIDLQAVLTTMQQEGTLHEFLLSWLPSQVAQTVDSDLVEIMTTIYEKMNHSRYLRIAERELSSERTRLNYGEMCSVILYSRGECNWELSRCMREDDDAQWSVFILCLNRAISKLHSYDEYYKNVKRRAPVYSGIRRVELKLDRGGFLAFTSSSRSRHVAERFRGREGLIIEIRPAVQGKRYCGDISWISHFPDEEEVLFGSYHLSGASSEWKRNFEDETREGANQFVVLDLPRVFS